MRTNLRSAVAVVFGHEGGYTNHPADPGNWSSGRSGVGTLIGTKYGIAAPTLIRRRGRSVTADDMRALTRDEADRIIAGEYWVTAGCDTAPDGCDLTLFDTSVNSGPSRARNIGVSAGDMRTAPVEWVKRYARLRLAFMQNLKTWKTFGKGWTRRVYSVEATSIRWAVAALGGKPSETLRDEAESSRAASKGAAKGAVVAGSTAGGAGASTQVEQAAAMPGWAIAAIVVAGVLAAAALGFKAWQQRQRQEAMEKEAQS